MTVRLGHIGISVRHLENSVKFYEAAFDGRLIFGPTKEVVAHASRMGKLCANKLGPQFKSLRLAVIKIDDFHGLELFEFPDAEAEAPLEYGEFLKKPGQFLFSMHAEDLERTCQKIIEAGGQRKSDILKLWDNEDWHIVYCTDIDGNTIELTSHSYVDMWFSKPRV